MQALNRVWHWVSGLRGLIGYAGPSGQRAVWVAIGWTAAATIADAVALVLLQRGFGGHGARDAAAGHQLYAVAGFLAAALVASILRLLATRSAVRAQHMINQALATRAYRALQYQSYADYLRHGASQGVATFEQLQLITYNALAPLITVMTTALSALVLCLAATLLYPLAGAVLLVSVALVAAEGAWRGTRSSAVGGAPGRPRARLLYESRTSFRDIYMANGQARMTADFVAIDGALRERQTRTVLAAQSSRHGVEIAAFVAGLVVLAIVGADPAAWHGALPVLGTLAFLAFRLLPQAATIRSSLAMISAHGEVTEEMVALLAAPTVLPARKNDIRLTAQIALGGVTVHRADRADTLRALDLVIPRGIRIGIRGASGAGKSTLLDILCGAIAPDAGSVLIDGRPLDAGNGAAWRDRIGLVAQQPLLLGRTLGEAVVFPQRFGTHDPQRYQTAIDQSGVAAMAASFGQGMDTPTGEALSRLSGGQRQRLALAHALYRAQDLLLLDEATGQLDADSEAAIVAVIGTLPRSLTVVIVSHRTAPLQHCDRVYRLDGGRLYAESD